MTKKFERVSRTRKLTPEEIASDEEIRRKVHEEFPPTQSAIPHADPVLSARL